MNVKLVIAIAAIAAMPVLAHAQKGAPPKGAAAKGPSTAEVQKVADQIKGDKAKLDAYCQMGTLSEQAAAAEEKKDQKKMADIGKQMEALAQKLGPDYAKLAGTMGNVNPDSKEGKAIDAIFESLDASCPK
jgi:hypothetical protein